jgi:tRNA pseudouridine38-40 synthase
MSQATWRAVVAYDGTNYHGFQRQKQLPSIQGQLEKSLGIILNEEVRIAGASRTDAGAHAIGQVISFHQTKSISAQDLVHRANAVLPKDIVFLKAELVEADFHARRRALWRRYRYYILNQPQASPFFWRYSLHVPQPLNVELMAKEAQVLVGKHDFTAFTTSEEKRSPIRQIYEISCWRCDDWVVIEVRANSFLHNMIRNIVASLIEIGKGNAEISLSEILHRKEQLKFAPVSSQGLFLEEVGYSVERLASSARLIGRAVHLYPSFFFLFSRP